MSSLYFSKGKVSFFFILLCFRNDYYYYKLVKRYEIIQ